MTRVILIDANKREVTEHMVDDPKEFLREVYKGGTFWTSLPCTEVYCKGENYCVLGDYNAPPNGSFSLYIDERHGFEFMAGRYEWAGIVAMVEVNIPIDLTYIAERVVWVKEAIK